MVQHDPAGADTQMPGTRRDLPDQDLRRGSGKAGGVVVLGNPVARVAEPIEGLGQPHRLPNRVPRRAPVSDRGLIEDAQAQHRRSLVAPDAGTTGGTLLC